MVDSRTEQSQSTNFNKIPDGAWYEASCVYNLKNSKSIHSQKAFKFYIVEEVRNFGANRTGLPPEPPPKQSP